MTLPRPVGSTPASAPVDPTYAPGAPTSADPYSARSPAMLQAPGPRTQAPKRLTREQYARRAGAAGAGHGAVAASRRRRTMPLAWLPLALLGALAALLLLLLLLGLGLRAGDGDTDPGARTGLPGDSSDEAAAASSASAVRITS